MAVMVRCKKCRSYYSVDNASCRCGNTDKVKSYYIQYCVSGGGGKTKLKFASHSLTEARALDAKYKYGDAEKEEKQKAAQLTFGEYLSRFFVPHFYAKNKAAEKSEYIIKRFRKAFENRQLTSIKAVEIEQATLKFTEGLSSSSLNNHISTIHRIFQYAVEIELLTVNPVRIKKSGEENIRRRFLNQDERVKILDACKKNQTPYLYEMAYIALFAGLRVNEIRKLKPENIRDGCIYISAGNAKSKKGRAVPMTKRLAELMETASFNYDFDIKRSFGTACRISGITDIVFHDLRRTYGSMLAQAGVPIFDISKLMGHSNVQITAKIYAHLLPENLARAVAKLPEI
jgi:integrase